MPEQTSALFESDQAFRLQFDPQNPSYHGGDQTPVPLGGRRIPSGCTEEPLQEVASRVDASSETVVSEEYRMMMKERAMVKELRDDITAVGKLVGMASGQQLVVRCDPQKAEADLNACLLKIKEMVEQYILIARSSTKQQVIEAIGAALTLCETLPTSKEAYGQFLLSLHSLTSKLFAEMNRLLTAMKRIKLNGQ